MRNRKKKGRKYNWEVLERLRYVFVKYLNSCLFLNVRIQLIGYSLSLSTTSNRLFN